MLSIAKPRPSDGLDVLRARLRAAHVPPARSGDKSNLRLATWNIRELGKRERLPESLHLIAAILRAFDLVSIVELRDDMRDLRAILRILGSDWDIVFSDYIGDAGGNRERVCFVFDKRRVRWTGLASNMDGPRRKVGDHYVRDLPWWRPPYLASFALLGKDAFDFILVAAHLRRGPTAKGRAYELGALCDWLLARAKEQYFGDRDVIALGDFNVHGPDTAAFRAVTQRGFGLPPGLGPEVDTGVARLADGKRYDHMLCLPRGTARFTGRAGAVDFYCGDHRPAVSRSAAEQDEVHVGAFGSSASVGGDGVGERDVPSRALSHGFDERRRPEYRVRKPQR